MGLRITKTQNPGYYQVTSTVSEESKVLSREQVIDFYLNLSKERAQDYINQWLDEIDSGKDWYNKQ